MHEHNAVKQIEARAFELTISVDYLNVLCRDIKCNGMNCLLVRLETQFQSQKLIQVRLSCSMRALIIK